MKYNILKFRNECAENGVEFTPAEAKNVHEKYLDFIDEIEYAVATYPNFYLELCNRTTEEKLEDIREMNERGQSITLKEYNELQAAVKMICETQGYV